MGTPVACVAWPKLEMVTQRPVVSVEGRRVVVGREGAPALAGLGTSIPGFVVGAVDVGRLRRAAVRWPFAAVAWAVAGR